MRLQSDNGAKTIQYDARVFMMNIMAELKISSEMKLKYSAFF
jgi:hypothetical protein